MIRTVVFINLGCSESIVRIDFKGFAMKLGKECIGSGNIMRFKTMGFVDETLGMECMVSINLKIFVKFSQN